MKADSAVYPSATAHFVRDEGISFRAHIATTVLPSIIDVCGSDERPRGMPGAQYYAKRAVEVADALIAELGREKSDG